MKLLLLFCAILSFTLSPFTAKALEKSVPVKFHALAKSHTTLTPIQRLGTRICMEYSISPNIADDVTELISGYIKKNTAGSGDDKSIVNFMNTNKDLLDCPDLDNEGVRRNIIKMAIDRDKVRPMIFDFLFKISNKTGVYIDFNAVDCIDGKCETPLDYLDNEITLTTDKVYLKKLNLTRKIMASKKYQAKRFDELPQAVKNQYLVN